MTTTIPRPSRLSCGPPTGLPILSKNSPNFSRPMTSHSDSPKRASSTSISKMSLRSPSGSHKKPVTGNSKNLPKNNSIPRSIASHETLRRQVSMNSFPQPPRGNRTTSLPPSPQSTANSLRSAKDPVISQKTKSVDMFPNNNAKDRRKNLENAKVCSNDLSSLLNTKGNTKSVSIDQLSSLSEYRQNLPSPPQSRCSSSQDSCPTTDINGDPERGRELSRDTSKSSEAKGNVLVSVRVRPDSSSNVHGKTDGEWMVDGRKSLVSFKGKETNDYYFDNVFTSHDNNAKVYDACAKRLVRRVMEGYHGTVFAYGMTGTGKTFSMQGTASSPGVIPLAITDIFSFIRETPSREFLLRVSYLEIYNEKIHDLLVPPSGNGVGASQPEEIKLRENSTRGVYACSLKEEIVQSPTQLLRVIARGDQARRVSSTQFNSRSSRSHAVVQIVVESRERMSPSANTTDKRSAIVPGGVRVSTLSLIDLAGSEKAAETKERRTEGSHINKSLLTLGTVIAKLSGNNDKEGKPTDKDGKHLPYRDSKLTRLLQGALSGNSLISILCTIQIGAGGSAAASDTHNAETLNTLKFASRAKNNIVSHARKAEEAHANLGDGAAKVLLERYRMEILELRNQLEAQNKAKMVEDEREREREAEQRHDEQMLEMQLARTALKERIDHLNRLILSSKSLGVNVSRSCSSLSTSQWPHLTSGNGYSSALSIRSSLSSIVPRNSMEGSIPQNPIPSIPLSTQRGYGEGHSHGSMEDEDSLGEYGDGTASLAAQNRALQADLADKTRYCQTLEKRLLQARRSSQSRVSLTFSNTTKGMRNEDRIQSLLREKDSEIAELKARLDDKDNMLVALRTSARSRDTIDRDFRSLLYPLGSSQSLISDRNSEYHPTHSTSLSTSSKRDSHESRTTESSSVIRSLPFQEQISSKNVDEVTKVLNNIIEDRIETGQLMKGVKGSVRIVNDYKATLTAL